VITVDRVSGFHKEIWDFDRRFCRVGVMGLQLGSINPQFIVSLTVFQHFRHFFSILTRIYYRLFQFYFQLSDFFYRLLTFYYQLPFFHRTVLPT